MQVSFSNLSCFFFFITMLLILPTCKRTIILFKILSSVFVKTYIDRPYLAVSIQRRPFSLVFDGLVKRSREKAESITDLLLRSGF